MEMMLFGIFVLVVGALSVIGGNFLNSPQGMSYVESLFGARYLYSTDNHGDPFLYAGIAIAIVGAVLIVAAIIRRNR